MKIRCLRKLIRLSQFLVLATFLLAAIAQNGANIASAAPASTCTPSDPKVRIHAEARDMSGIFPVELQWYEVSYTVIVKNNAPNACDIDNLDVEVTLPNGRVFPLELGYLAAGETQSGSSGRLLYRGPGIILTKATFIANVQGTAVTLCNPPCAFVSASDDVTVPIKPLPH